MQTVENSKPWPEMQRFDFVVRVREISKEDASSWEKNRLPGTTVYQQAVLNALYRMTGINAGTKTSVWRERLDLAGKSK